MTPGVLLLAGATTSPAYAADPTETELTRLLSRDTDMVAVFNVGRCAKLTQGYSLELSGIDVLSWFRIDKPSVSAVYAVVKGRDCCALVLKCPRGTGPVMEKMAKVLKASASRPRGKIKNPGPAPDNWKELEAGVYLMSKSRRRGQLLAQLSDELVLWSMYDDAKGSLGLEIVTHWREEPKEPVEPAPELVEVCQSSANALMAWRVLRPGSLENDGVSHAIRRLRNIGLKSIRGRAWLDGDLYREEAIYEFASPEAASRFVTRAKEERTDEWSLVADFTTPLEHFMRKGAPVRFPDELTAEGPTVRATRSVELAAR